MTVLGLCCCMGSSLVVASGGYSLVAIPVPLLLTVVAFLIVAHGLSCSTACEIFLDQGSNPTSSALASRLFTVEPPGKPRVALLK